MITIYNVKTKVTGITTDVASFLKEDDAKKFIKHYRNYDNTLEIYESKVFESWDEIKPKR